MKTLRSVVVLVLALALSAHVLAADYQAGLEAFERDDYATALKEWCPLAEQATRKLSFTSPPCTRKAGALHRIMPKPQSGIGWPPIRATRERVKCLSWRACLGLQFRLG